MIDFPEACKLQRDNERMDLRTYLSTTCDELRK